ncbi:hypothetical protein ARMSODRAFT_983989 [Armillaria solidipes]|uniref:Uncharacterized protein n=1 Tax=Armillaria solidipes TaxID=1076256 RepID=A0A2H3B5E7_9AGAR|nr:hypothetical protein ARMSODRAFT_983989 [Armillaria solidipes]
MASGIFEDVDGLRTSHMMIQILHVLLLQSLSSECQDIKTIEEIFHPKIPPTEHHILIIYPEAAAKPVLYLEIFDGLSSLHGTSNCISCEMTTQDWLTLMGHVEGLKKFGRDANVQDALIKLTAEARVALVAEPELIEMDNERKKVASLIQSASKQLTCANISEESKTELEVQIDSLRQEKKKLISKHKVAFKCLTHNIKTIEEIFHPKIPPTEHHILIIYPEAAAKPVLYLEIFDGLSSLHGTSNCISCEMTTQDWLTLMGHVEGLKKFGRDANVQDALIKLTAEARVALVAEPELIEMDNERKKVSFVP